MVYARGGLFLPLAVLYVCQELVYALAPSFYLNAFPFDYFE